MKILKINSFILFTFCTFVLSAGNFYDGYLITLKGEVKRGSIEMFNGSDSQITFKETQSKSKIKFKSAELKEIGFVENGSKDTIIYRRYKFASYTWGKKPKLSKDQIWAYKVYSSDKVEGFYSPSPQVVHGGGAIRSWQMFTAYVKFPDKDHMFHVFDLDKGMSDPFNTYDKMMRKYFANVIEDKCPEMLEKIKEKKYKTEDFEKMLDDYSKICK